MDGIKGSKEAPKPRQKVKFEVEDSDLEELVGSGVKGWLDGDYKVGDINFAIANVTHHRQVETRTSWDMAMPLHCLFVCLLDMSCLNCIRCFLSCSVTIVSTVEKV